LNAIHPEGEPRVCFQTLYLPVCCGEDPPQLLTFAPALKRGENQVLVPLKKGDARGISGARKHALGMKGGLV